MFSLTLLIITKNAEKLLDHVILSAKGIVDRIVIVDNVSTDKTIEIAKKYSAKIINYNGNNLGEQRNIGLQEVKTEWVLVLDSDERLSLGLKQEIQETLSRYSEFDGFFIPFQNHFLGKEINHGGENYSMLRLFRTDSATIKPDLVHEGFKIKDGRISKLKNKIIHYSYRSLSQTFTKFTDYSFREAQQKFEAGERSSLKKIFMYPPHMFWARFIKDKGYKDGMFRIPLDLGFAYMDFLTYVLLAIKWLRLARK